MATALLVDAVRTGIGKRGGALSMWHPVDLAAQPLQALVERNGLDPTVLDDVVMGCTMMVGEQAMNIARNAALAAGFPVTVPGTTVDRQCGSAQQAIHFAAQAVIADAMDVVIAGGIESMSRVPIGATTEHGPGEAYGPLYKERFSLIHQGECAQQIAHRWEISREEMDAFSFESHQRADAASNDGAFGDEMIVLERDEGIRPDTTMERLGNLRPAFFEDGTITAGNSSQISDGAAAVLIASEDAVKRLGLRARARFHTFVVAANDPEIMLTAPIPATEKILHRAKMRLDDFDVIEINEAFASVVLAWEREFQPDMKKVNPLGGAIALGHPTGCSGARIMATMLHELERSGGRYGLQIMCEGGGQANATIIERLSS